MIIECILCHKRYSIDDVKIPLGGVKVKCHYCGNIIFLKKDVKPPLEETHIIAGQTSPKSNLAVNKFIDEYNETLEKAERLNHPITWSISFFLRSYFKEKEYDFLIDVFGNNTKLHGKKLETVLATGIVYIEKGKHEQLIGIRAFNRSYITASKYFKLALKIDPDNPETSAWLSYAYMLQCKSIESTKYYNLEKILISLITRAKEEALSSESLMKRILIYHGVQLCRLASEIDAYNDLWLAFKWLHRGEDKKAAFHAKKAINHNRRNYLANWLLGKLFLKYGKLDKAQRYFVKCARMDPYIPDTHYKLGIVALRKMDFENASRFFDFVEKTGKMHNIAIGRIEKDAEILHYFSIAMSDWHKGLLTQVENNLTHTYQLVKLYRIPKRGFVDMMLKLLPIDKRIVDLSHAENFVDLANRVYKILTIIVGLTEQKKCKPYRKLINSKFMYISLLFSVLNKSCGEIFTQNIKEVAKEYKIPIEGLSSSNMLVFMTRNLKDILKPIINPSTTTQLINSLENFIIEVNKYPSIEKIPIHKQRALIKSLIPFLDDIDGTSTRYTGTKFATENIVEQKINLLYSKLDTIETQVQKTGQEVTGLTKEIMPLKAILKKIKVETLLSTEDKKIKILTNIDQEGQEHEEISEIIFGEKRVKFLPKGEIVNRRNMAMRLLQYFVLRKQIHWLYGYIVFKAWHKRRIRDHKKAFSKIISQLKGPRKGIFTENDLPLTIEPVLFHRGTYELEGDYISNLDILADIFKKGTNIDELVKKINNLREEEFELIKYFLRELKDDYESGCRAILNAKKNNHIAYWDTVANRPFLEIQWDKAQMKDVLIKLGEKMEEQVNKDFMVWQNMINHIKSYVIDGYISILNRQQLLNEIEVDDDFRPIYTELLKESEDIRIENQIGIDAWHRLHLETIGGIELDVRRFGTTEGIIKFIRSKTKRKLHGLKYQKTDEEESYERYKRDFKKAERDFEQKINRLPTYEDIGKELVKHYHWTAERFSDFLALKEEKEAFRHIEEKDNNTKDTKTKGI